MRESSGPWVHLVEDEPVTREMTVKVLRDAGHKVAAFTDPAKFLAECTPEMRGCVILDEHFPGMLGTTIVNEMRSRNIRLPVIFVSGSSDLPKAVRAMRRGAVDWLSKPADWTVLRERVDQALKLDMARVDEDQTISEIKRRYLTLSPRETEVLDYLITGTANKVTAMKLGISERTVEIHRSRVHSKMGTNHIAELALAIDQLRRQPE